MSEFYPSIPQPDASPGGMLVCIMRLKMAVELLTGQRGTSALRAWTASEATAVRTVKLLTFTLNTLPPAAALPQHMAYVSDGAGNAPIVVSDGTVWRYADGTAV
jgi:hypothetical protein